MKLLRLKNLYHKVVNDVFLKILIVFIVAISIPAICISTLLLKFSADNIIRQVGTSTNNLLSVKTRIIDQKFSEMDSLVKQLVFNKNIEYIEDREEVDINEPIIMYDIIQLFKEMVSSNALIDSIYFYDDSSNFVVTDTTKYTKLDFADREILDIDFNGERCAVYRKAKNMLLQEKDVISYITKFKYFTNTKTAYFVINLDYKELFVNSIQGNLDTLMELLIFDENKNIIFTSNIDFHIYDRANIEDILKTNVQNPVISIGSTEYYVSKTYTQILNWTIVYIQPYSSIVQTASLLQRMSMPLIAAVLFLSIVISYIFTVYLYKPMAKLILEVEKYTGVCFDKKENAYSTINEILKDTFSKYNELVFKYQFAFPYFQQHFVNEILDEESANIERFKEALTLININFKFSKYVTVLIDFENVKFTKEIETFIRTYLHRTIKNTAFLLSKIQDARVVIIFNTDEEIEEIYGLLSVLKNELNKKNILLTISLGQIYDVLDKMCKSIKDVLNQMENKFFNGKYEIIYNNRINNHSNNNRFIYDKCLEDNLINHIKSQDYDLAIQTLKDIMNSVVLNVKDIDNIKYVYFRLANFIVHSMSEIGIELPEGIDSDMYVIEATKKAGTNQELLDFISDLILKYIMLIKDFRKMQHTNLVAKTINYIENNYHREITQEEVAANVYLSSRHLNNLFKAETNLTIVDYITKLRMEKSREMILYGNKKIKEIAFAVGYNNIQTFLRLFKKFFGMTPIQYKRMCS